MFVRRFQVFSISKAAAQAFVQRIVMQTVFDVLEQQGRSALLPDAIISGILGQIGAQINYEPLECKAVAHNAEVSMNIRTMADKQPHCTVIGSTLTGTCPQYPGGMCEPGMPDKAIVPITTRYTTISGTLTISNIIMANWSRQMWQSLLNRAVRMLASGPFRLHFFSASATIS
ncbi:hypothetical protein KIN20_034268 [Parelaphostrongylus tenuis]|uniref:Uncharacterized protein n=1 Tax=Parelaphostrongylus tenuis TaxID=148309 RepID=A0AAD5R9X2_PARTN|nr:hypothetical protein KIN20_034268 [Parelaphostrongylus tenuis]